MMRRLKRTQANLFLNEMSMLLARVQPELVHVDVFPCLSTPESGNVSGNCGT